MPEITPKNSLVYDSSGFQSATAIHSSGVTWTEPRWGIGIGQVGHLGHVTVAQRSLGDIMRELKDKLQQERADRELARELIQELQRFEKGDERRLG